MVNHGNFILKGEAVYIYICTSTKEHTDLKLVEKWHDSSCRIADEPCIISRSLKSFSKNSLGNSALFRNEWRPIKAGDEMGPLNCVISREHGGASQDEVSGYVLQPNPFEGGGGWVTDKSIKDDLDLDAVDIMGEVIFTFLATQQTGKQYRFMIAIRSRPGIGPRLNDTHCIVFP